MAGPDSIIRLKLDPTTARTIERVVLTVFFICAAAGNPDAEPGPDWLERLNLYRATALLPPVVEDPGLSGAVLEHARYMVVHGVVRHTQNRRDTWATPGGAAAAAASNLAGSIRPTEPDSWAVDLWMQAPFHALGILDPALDHVGFGIHHARSGRVQTAAGLDVINGRSTAPRSIAYPVVWPANGSSVPLATHTVEDPSPLTSCPGYRAPTGLPLIVQLGSGESGAAGHRFVDRRGGAPARALRLRRGDVSQPQCRPATARPQHPRRTRRRRPHPPRALATRIQLSRGGRSGRPVDRLDVCNQRRPVVDVVDVVELRDDLNRAPSRPRWTVNRAPTATKN